MDAPKVDYMGDYLLAVDLGAGHSSTEILGGDTEACNILDNASVKYCGYNGLGQLGQGTSAIYEVVIFPKGGKC